MSHQLIPPDRAAKQAVPQPAAQETGDMYLSEYLDEEGPATNLTQAVEEKMEENSRALPSEAPQLSSSDLAKLIAEKAPGLLDNIDTIKELFQETYANQTRASQEKADRSSSSQQTPASQAQKTRPSAEGNTRSPSYRHKQTSVSSRSFGERHDRSSLYPTDKKQDQMRLPAVEGSSFSSSYLPNPRQMTPASTSDHFVPSLPNEVLPPMDSDETDSDYHTESEDSDDEMTDTDGPRKKIAARPRAQQSEMDMEPDAKRSKLETANPSMAQNLGSVPAPLSPSARQELLDLLDDPNLPSEFYKMRLLELLTVFKDDKEKLQHIKDPEEARDKELQILLLRTDIEKQRVLLKAQKAYEEATDGEEQVVLNLTQLALTPGSDGSYGVLPRPSAFMLKAILKLGDELEVLKAELEGKEGEEDSEETAAKTLRVENLRFFMEKLMGYYNADLEREEEIQRQRDDPEQEQGPSTVCAAVQTSMTDSPVRYPTQMIHDNPKAAPPLDTRVQPWRAAHATTAVPSCSPQPLEDSDASARDKPGRRRPQLPRRDFYELGADVIEEDMASESDDSMYADEET